MRERFIKYNELCFGGELPECAYKLSRAESFLGKMEWKCVRGFWGRIVRCENFTMKISTFRDMPQDTLDDVIIHEMIHYYIAYKGIRDTSAHGRVFREMMTRINNEFGRHIVISHKRSEADFQAD